ncbi:MAG: hypothetical protein ACRDHF_16325 [Tepidiformaceae bacterium]
MPASSFAADRSKAGGRKSICRECDREKSKRYYHANRDRILRQYADQREAERGGYSDSPEVGREW